MMRTLLWFLGGMIGAMEFTMSGCLFAWCLDSMQLAVPCTMFAAPTGALVGMYVATQSMDADGYPDVDFTMPVLFVSALLGALFSWLPLLLLQWIPTTIFAIIFFAQLGCLWFVCKLIGAQRNAL